MAAALLDDYSKGSVLVGDQQALDGLAGSVVVPDGCGQGQDAGDVIMPPGAGDELLVKAVRLGQGRVHLIVRPTDDAAPEAERFITLTAATHLRKRG